MGSPCVLLNSLVLFFLSQGRRGLRLMKPESVNCLSKRQANGNHPGEGETLKGTKRKPLHMADTHILTHLFSCLPFVK